MFVLNDVAFDQIHSHKFGSNIRGYVLLRVTLHNIFVLFFGERCFVLRNCGL